MIIFISTGAFYLGHNVREVFGGNAGLLFIEPNYHTAEHANKERKQRHAKGTARKLWRNVIEPTRKRETAIVPQQAEPGIHQKEERPDESARKRPRQHHARHKEHAVRRLHQVCHFDPFPFIQGASHESCSDMHIRFYMRRDAMLVQKPKQPLVPHAVAAK